MTSTVVFTLHLVFSIGKSNQGCALHLELVVVGGRERGAPFKE